MKCRLWAGGQTAAVLVVGVLLASCAATTPTEDAPGNVAVSLGSVVATRSAPFGTAAPLGSIAPEAIPAALAERRDALAAVFPAEIAAGSVVAPKIGKRAIELQIDSAVFFEVASAQLRPQALAMISRLAKWMRADGQVVLQVEGRETVQTVDDLGARRAASIGEFLVAEGAPAGRVRAQGVSLALVAPPGTPPAEVAVFVIPVETGAEAAAWSVSDLVPSSP